MFKDFEIWSICSKSRYQYFITFMRRKIELRLKVKKTAWALALNPMICKKNSLSIWTQMNLMGRKQMLNRRIKISTDVQFSVLIYTFIRKKKQFQIQIIMTKWTWSKKIEYIEKTNGRLWRLRFQTIYLLVSSSMIKPNCLYNSMN